MQNLSEKLKSCALFEGVDADGINSMLSCLGAQTRSYKKGESVYRAGDTVEHVAVLLEGELHVQSDDFWGNRSIVGRIAPGEMFAEAYASTVGVIGHDVVATADSEAVFFDVRRVLTTCPAACPFHTAVVKNLFFAISAKTRTLMRKLSHMSRRTTREKLMSYLSDEASRHGSSTFTIPFNRQQLADFLSVDRSAMSAELGKMRDDGLLRFDKNTFQLYEFNEKA